MGEARRPGDFNRREHTYRQIVSGSGPGVGAPPQTESKRVLQSVVGVWHANCYDLANARDDGQQDRCNFHVERQCFRHHFGVGPVTAEVGNAKIRSGFY